MYLASAYTHRRGVGRSEVSNGAQTSKQLSQLKDNSRGGRTQVTKERLTSFQYTGQFVRLWRKHKRFITMALFSWMFLSRFRRLWHWTFSLSSSSSSSSSSSFCFCCCCFIFLSTLTLCEQRRVSLTDFLTFFSGSSWLGVDNLLAGNLRNNNKIKVNTNLWFKLSNMTQILLGDE